MLIVMHAKIKIPQMIMFDHLMEHVTHGLFHIHGLSHNELKNKLFPLPLEDEALKCYRSLDNTYIMT